MDDDRFKDLGALLDTRTTEEKEKDWTFEEIVSAAAPVTWVEKDLDDLRKFPVQDQNGSGSCVAQTLKKMMGVYVWLKTQAYLTLSASHIYQRRVNRPNGGMIATNAFDIGQKGVTLEVFAPSEDLNDREMDAVEVTDFEKRVGETFSLGNYFSITEVGNIDKIASIIQETGKGVMIWFYFTSSEWSANKNGDFTVPEIRTNLSGPTDSRSLRHSVAGIDFCLYNGKKAIIADDSAHFGGKARRIITEDFFEKRNWYAGHFMNLKFEDQTTPEPNPDRPVHTFLRDLEFSPVYNEDPEVVILQDILKYEGCFPQNVQSSGYYGSVTKTSVGKFQLKHGVVNSSNDAGFGRVGPLTRAKLNELYGS